jgi:(p)ppGpp synthase/HD superfamily hydrolase
VTGTRLADALGYAATVHQTQLRKSTQVPYISHLLAVCARVIEAGGDEDVAIAALLHDSIEDQGVRAPELAARFGDRVAAIVVGCTDTDVRPKPPWRPRKEAWLARLVDAPDDVVLVAAADKLHNARSMVLDVRAHGPAVWARFHAGPDDQLWYHRAVAEIVSRRMPGPLADELRSVVDDLARVVPRAGSN